MPWNKLLHDQICNKTLPDPTLQLIKSPAEPVFSIAGKLQSSETVGPGRCPGQPEHAQHGAEDEVNLGVAFWIIKVLVRVTNIKHQTNLMKGLGLARLMGDNSLPESSVQKAHHSNKYIKLCIRREIETLQKCNFAILVFIFCERNSTRFSVGQIYRLREGVKVENKKKV